MKTSATRCSEKDGNGLAHRDDVGAKDDASQALPTNQTKEQQHHVQQQQQQRLPSLQQKQQQPKSVGDKRVEVHFPFIGGPGTSLPYRIESFLCWCLCIACLTVSGYHYVVSTLLVPAAVARWKKGWYRGMKRSVAFQFLAVFLFTEQQVVKGGYNDTSLMKQTQEKEEENEEVEYDEETKRFLNCWIPLMTCSRSELSRLSPYERYEQLLAYLHRRSEEENTNDDSPSSISSSVLFSSWQDDDAALVEIIRSDEIARRLVSLMMRPYVAPSTTATQTKTAMAATKATTITTITTTLIQSMPQLDLPKRFARLWPYLLSLPPPLNDDGITITATEEEESRRYKFDISMIVPAYHESGIDMERKLSIALEYCTNPETVEVLIVDAGGCTNLDHVLWKQQPQQQKQQQQKQPTVQGMEEDECNNNNTATTTKTWGKIHILTFDSQGGGRGPCLNYGAYNASGRILTFCHSDTKLPRSWDVRIRTTLLSTNNNNGIRANSCAFKFGIDTTTPSHGLNNGKSYPPPGIKAVEYTANIRTNVFSLPYGDQVLSIPTNVFEYLGGYPDQCLMEDYELVGLLRKRATLLPKLIRSNTSSTDGKKTMAEKEERLVIVPGDSALCSPRRWQKYGVLYVTYMNSKFVTLYDGTRKLGPEKVFRLYYGVDPPKRDTELSPWEVRMLLMMKKKEEQLK